MKTIIRNGKIVTPDTVLEQHAVVIEEDRIKEIVPDGPGLQEESQCGQDGRCGQDGQYGQDNPVQYMDAHGGYIMPGFIDVHSDKIEQFILPRPTAQIDYGLAMAECERELVGLGVTTVYHSFSLYRDEFFGKSPLRTKESVKAMASLVKEMSGRDRLIHHRFHLRLEIDNFEGYEIAKSMIEENLVHEISFMDHTPGQGQYQDLAVYQEQIEKYQGKEVREGSFESILEYHKSKDRMTLEQIKDLAAMARDKGITTASHDDDCPGKLKVNQEIGVVISEFPITIDIARQARSQGFHTVVGAPNVLLGGSHSGNMSAAEAIADGSADIICSDYFPQAILHSLFIMNQDYGVDLPEVVKKATLNPAIAMGTQADYGSVEPGKKADLLVVKLQDERPAVSQVLIDGSPVLSMNYRR